jgi:uncharacterized protein (TIGR02594 family)
MADLQTPPWLTVATKLLGVKETPGPKSNPTIIGWAKALGGWVASFYKDDATPWCGLGVGFCMHEAGIRPAAKTLSALGWLDWGQKLASPAYGCVIVFRRKGGGHVGFYIGENATSYKVRGFNQHDSVCDTWVAKDRCAGYRWPFHYPVPQGARVITAETGSLSTNEA